MRFAHRLGSRRTAPAADRMMTGFHEVGQSVHRPPCWPAARSQRLEMDRKGNLWPTGDRYIKMSIIKVNCLEYTNLVEEIFADRGSINIREDIMNREAGGIPEDVRNSIRALVRNRGPVPMPDRIFRQARDYHECALRCLELRGQGQNFLFMPSLVLLAFAIELYIKGILEFENNPTKGHNHVILFRKLSTERRDEISAIYQVRYDGRDLSDDLPGYSELFTQERYAYETNDERSQDMVGIAQFASALYNVWCKLRPDLVVVGLAHNRMSAPVQGVPIIEDSNFR